MARREQVDVGTGRWDERHARRMLEAWRRSGQTVYGFCRDRGLDPQRLYWWRKRLEGEGPRAGSALALVPAVVEGAGPREEPEVVVRVGDLVEVEVMETSAVSPTWVAAVVKGLVAER